MLCARGFSTGKFWPIWSWGWVLVWLFWEQHVRCACQLHERKAELSPLPARYHSDSLAAYSCFFFFKTVTGQGVWHFKGVQLLFDFPGAASARGWTGFAGGWWLASSHPWEGWVVMAAMPMMEKNNTFGTELGECDVCIVLLCDPHGMELCLGMSGKTLIFSTQDTEALLHVSLGCKTLSD